MAAAIILLSGCGAPGKFLRDDRGDKVVLINTFTVPAGKADEAVASWEAARDFLREQDGYISTRLHRSLSDDARYQLVNVAKWESAEKFRAAAAALRESGVFRPVAGVQSAPQLYTVIRGGRK